MPREFKATPAFRHAVPLLIGIAGPPGAGKTYSALVLATGIKAHRGGPIIVIDTERDRALRYAPPEGVAANGVDHFEFMHVPFSPPFGSQDFLEAIMQQRKHKPSSIIVDSLSDEHEGEGGLLDVHDQTEARLGPASWLKPKADRRDLIGGMMQIKTPLIFCFRAREKTKPIVNEKGKQVPTNVGWTPIAPPEIVHNMDIFALLPIKSDGVPMWKGNTAYEDFSIKLPRQFQNLFPTDRAINQEMGQAMSIWALGDQKLEASTLPQSATGAAIPADPAPTAATEQSPALTADPSLTGFSDYAELLAAADDWPQISLAFAQLRASTSWKAAGAQQRTSAWAVAYRRLKQLTDGGYAFDFLSDLHAYRGYLECETDLDAIIGNRRAMGASKLFMGLDTAAKKQFDQAEEAAIVRVHALIGSEFS